MSRDLLVQLHHVYHAGEGGVAVQHPERVAEPPHLQQVLLVDGEAHPEHLRPELLGALPVDHVAHPPAHGVLQHAVQLVQDRGHCPHLHPLPLLRRVRGEAGAALRYPRREAGGRRAPPPGRHQARGGHAVPPLHHAVAGAARAPGHEAVVTSGSPAPPSPRLRDDAAVGAVDHLPPEVRRARAEPDHHLVGGLEQLAGQHGGQPELGGGEAVPQQHHEGRGDLAVAAVRGGEGGVLVRQTEKRLLLVSANQRLPKMQTC